MITTPKLTLRDFYFNKISEYPFKTKRDFIINLEHVLKTGFDIDEPIAKDISIGVYERANKHTEGFCGPAYALSMIDKLLIEETEMFKHEQLAIFFSCINFNKPDNERNIVYLFRNMMQKYLSRSILKETSNLILSKRLYDQPLPPQWKMMRELYLHFLLYDQDVTTFYVKKIKDRSQLKEMCRKVSPIITTVFKAPFRLDKARQNLKLIESLT